MALRLIELILSEGNIDEVTNLLKGKPVFGVWNSPLSDNQILFKILVSMEESEALLDLLQKHFSWNDRFRIMIYSLEAAIPRPVFGNQVPDADNHKSLVKSRTKKSRVSREELYSDISDTVGLTPIYMVLVILSTIVAAIGILNNDNIIIIGAMVIAPLLGPNVAFALAATLADSELAWKSLKVSIAGVVTAILLSIIVGVLYPVDPTISSILSRTNVGVGEILLAIASGTAGTLAFTTGISSALVGVMIAVALLPPLVTAGILIGSGYSSMAFGAFLLFLTNLICINLSGVLTFVFQGIRPRNWWEASKAKKLSRTAITLWLVLLFILVIIIIFSRQQ